MKRKNIFRKLLVLGASALTIAAASSASAKDSDKFKASVGDKLSLAPAGGVELKGCLAKSLDTSYNGDIMAWDIDDLLKPFQERPEDKAWRIEFWGKWFTSAALAYDYHPCAILDARLKYAVDGLIKTQTPDGQITSYAAGKEFGTWDMWGRKYVMLGLLAEYNRTGAPKVLAAVKKHADYILERFGKDKKNICDIGMWNGMASSSILEPFVNLYRATNEQKYLDFCMYIVDAWTNSKAKPDLLKKALAEQNVYDMFEKPSGGKNGYGSGGASKSYEMMSGYEGLLELYRVTGKPEYKTAVANLVRNVRDTEITVLGSGSIWERWIFGKFIQQRESDHWMETCVTATWIKICTQMLRISGDSSFADDIELAAYNALICAQMKDGKWWAHYSPMHGSRKPAPEQCGMHMNCCVASGPRGLFLLPKMAYMTSDKGVAVNIYEAGSGTLPIPSGKVKISVSGADFVENDTAVIDISQLSPSGADFEIALRIPRWSKDTKVLVNGEPVKNVKAGEYLKIARKWSNNDKIIVKFDMATRLVQDPANSTMSAIERGPFVFAMDKKFEKNFDKPANVKLDKKGNVVAKLVEQDGATVALDVSLKDGSTRRFVNYASAGQTWSDESTFHVWFKNCKCK